MENGNSVRVARSLEGAGQGKIRKVEGWAPGLGGGLGHSGPGFLPVEERGSLGGPVEERGGLEGPMGLGGARAREVQYPDRGQTI